MAPGGLTGEKQPHPHVPLLWAAGVAGVEGLLTPGQGLGGEARPGVLHGDGQRLFIGGDRKGHRAARRGVPGRVVQQVAHRPVQAGPVHGQAQGRGRGTPERDLLPGAEALADPSPAVHQVLQADGLPFPARRHIPAGHGPQLGHIVLEPEGAVEDGVGHLPLGRGERVLLQQLRVAADDGEGRLEVVGQGGQLQVPLPLHGPLALQGPGQVRPELVHGLQGLPELPHPSPAGQRHVQPPLGDGLRGGGEEGGVPAEEARKVPGGDRPGGQPGQEQHDGGAALELRQPPLEHLGPVGHGVVVLQNACRAVGQLDQLVVLGVKKARVDGLPVQGGLGVAQVAFIHIPGVRHPAPAVEEDPAVVVGDVRRVQLPGGEGLHHRPHPHRGGVGRVDDAHPHQNGHPSPPEDGQYQDGPAGGEQVPPEQGCEAAPPPQTLFHL